jgi:hypothetical protein
MNRKGIVSVLKKKFNQWLATIDDEAVKKDVKENTIITGGSIVSLLMNKKPKDYDVYFKTMEATRRVAEYYISKFNSSHDKKAFLLDGSRDYDIYDNDLPHIDGLPAILENLDKGRLKICFQTGGVAGNEELVQEEPFEDICEVISDLDDEPGKEPEKKEPFRPVFLSPNAITLSNDIQIIIRFYGEVEEIHKNYDFIHCTNSWESQTGKLVLPPVALESILSKHLHYQGSKYPVCSAIRMRKFIKRGWHINAGQILKILFQISKLDLTNINVLEDQLVGVDSAYFGMLIDALKEKQKESDDFKINGEYISAIIDKIF